MTYMATPQHKNPCPVGHETILVDPSFVIIAELVFVVSGTTNMYPGYRIVYKNVPVFWSLPEYVPCAYCSVP